MLNLFLQAPHRQGTVTTRLGLTMGLWKSHSRLHRVLLPILSLSPVKQPHWCSHWCPPCSPNHGAPQGCSGPTPVFGSQKPAIRSHRRTHRRALAFPRRAKIIMQGAQRKLVKLKVWGFYFWSLRNSLPCGFSFPNALWDAWHTFLVRPLYLRSNHWPFNYM